GGNLVTVRLDGSENPAIPPFGGRIDYLTYAGLYRDVWLKVVPALSIGRVKVETPEPLSPRKRVRARIWLEAPGGAPATGVLTARLRGPGGTEIAVQTLEIDGPAAELAFGGLTGI